VKRVKRFGVSIEEDLLKVVDDFIKKHKFPNRSCALRFLIRKNLVEEKWQQNKEVAACLVLVYDHHRRGLVSKAIEIQHKYPSLVLSTQHIHLDHHNCLEMIALKGKAELLRELADRLIGLKGIKHGRLVATAID